MSINNIIMSNLEPIDNKFIEYAISYLDIKNNVSITISDNHSASMDMTSFGYYNPTDNKVWVLRGSRIKADWYRTLAHELVHFKQNEDNKVLSGETGSDIENEANSLAGIILRNFAKQNPEIFDITKSNITESII